MSQLLYWKMLTQDFVRIQEPGPYEDPWVLGSLHMILVPGSSQGLRLLVLSVGSRVSGPLYRVLGLGSSLQCSGSQVLSTGSWFLSPHRVLIGSWVAGPICRIPGLRSSLQGPGSWVLFIGPGSQVLSTGLWFLSPHRVPSLHRVNIFNKLFIK